MNRLWRWFFKDKGEVSVGGIAAIIGVLTMVILAPIMYDVLFTLSSGAARAKLESSGYIVLGAGEYASIDALLDAIKVKTDALPSDPADQSLILSEIEEFEEHFHNEELWFGISADQSGEDWGEQDTLSPFRATSGNNAWGTAGTDPAKLAGLLDSGSGEGDFHRILVVANTSSTVYKG